MNRKLLAGMVAFSLWGFATSQVSAAEPVLNELYGRGVHAYNDHNYEEAHKQFTEAIEQGTRDPRTYFFRGVVYSKLGRPEQAAADFRTAAGLEVAYDGPPINIGKSLERVQGGLRLEIEKIRRESRIAASRKDATEAQAKFEKAAGDERRVTRRAGANAPALDPATAPQVKGNDPFNEGVGVGAEEKAPEKVADAPAAVPTSRDPFAEPPPAKGGAADPLAGNQPAPAGEVDPFGGDEPAAPKPTKPAAEDDPFGGDSTPAPTPKPAPANDDDPFGGAEMPEEPAAPAPKPAAPAAEEDPFGGDAEMPEKEPAPAKEPAANPFGDDPEEEAAPAPKAVDEAEPMAVGGAKKGGLFGSIFRAAVKSVPGDAKAGETKPAIGRPLPPAPVAPPATPPAPKGAEDDPFGAGAIEPAVPAPADDLPPPAEDDPFGDPAPKAEPAPAPSTDDDPFGS